MADDMLTDAEQHALEITGELEQAAHDLIGHAVPGDHDEFTHHLHAIQNMILAQAAARAYPGRYRLLGEL